MKSYTLNYTGSGEVVELHARDDMHAIALAAERLGGEPVVAAAWTADEPNDAGERCRRIAFWPDVRAAAQLDPERVVAWLSTIGDALKVRPFPGPLQLTDD